MKDVAPNSWEARADRNTFYGFTDFATIDSRGAVVVTHGKGPYIFDAHGRQYLDANSGLWNMVAGFDHQGLADVAKAFDQTVVSRNGVYSVVPAGGANMLQGTKGKLGQELNTGKWKFLVKGVQRVDSYMLKYADSKFEFTADPGTNCSSCRRV